MTRPVYFTALALFCACLLAGVYFTVPRPDELWPRELDCATWRGEPVEGRVRLVGCTLDARYPDLHHRDTMALDVLVPVVTASEAPPRLYVFSEAPDLLSWGDQILSFGTDEPRYQRYSERHHARLVRVRDVVGTLGPPEGEAAALVRLHDDAPPDVLVLDETEEDPTLRWLGAMLLLLGLLGALAIVLLQRKWTRSSERLSGQARPLRF